MVKLTINIYIEYTDNENDVVWLDSIESIIRNNLEKHKIGLVVISWKITYLKFL